MTNRIVMPAVYAYPTARIQFRPALERSEPPPRVVPPGAVEDNARGIVSTAVIDYICLAPITNNDPMRRQ